MMGVLSSKRIGLDIDGCIAAYGIQPGERPLVNLGLIFQLATWGVTSVSLISNQGGLPFGIKERDVVQDLPVSDDKLITFQKFPTPNVLAYRLIYFDDVLAFYGIRVRDIHLSLHHDNAASERVDQAADELKYALDGMTRGTPFVYTSPTMRKPNPGMLKEAQINMYFGDSAEDEQAARAAHCEFVLVPRFRRES